MTTTQRVLAAACAAAAGLATAALVLDRDDEPRAPAPVGREAQRATTNPAAAPAGVPTRRLSDERTRSRFAFVRRPTVARERPVAGAERVARLRTRTEDRTPEVVLALEQTRTGDAWVKVRLPARPNGTTGWVPRRALGRYHVVTTALHVDRRRLRAVLYDRGREVWRAPVAVGKAAAPTPTGRFYVRSRIVPTEPGGTYGVFAFGTNGFSPALSDWPGGGVVGLHGTDRPELIPGRVSHGCVRLRNRDIARLRGLMPLGTPVVVV